MESRVRLNDLLDHHLRHAIGYGGHAQNPLPSTLFRNGDGAHRRWKVASRAHPVPDLVEIAPQVGLELLDRLPIHAGRPSIGFDRFVRFVHPALIDMERFVCRIASTSSCFQLFRSCNHLTRSLRSSPITGPSSLLRIGPPQCSASVLSPRGFRRLSFSLGIGATGSCSSAQKPASDSRPLYAGRHPPSHQAPGGLVPERYTLLVSTTLES